MSLWSRFINVFRSDALSREIGEEFEAHIADAIADGVDPWRRGGDSVPNGAASRRERIYA